MERAFDYVIVGGGSAGCVLANRLIDGPVEPGARPGGRPARLLVGRLHPHAGGAHVPDRQPLLRLEVRVRTRAAHGRPPDLSRAREGARRLEQHQRDDLPARQPARLRALGADPGMETWDYAHCLPYFQRMEHCLAAEPGDEFRGAQPARSSSNADRPRTRCSARSSRPSQQAGYRADRRRERLPTGGVRGVRPEHPPRAAALGGARVPAPGDVAPEPRGPNAGVRVADRVRGLARGRRRGVARPRRARADPRRRGDRVRRRDQLAPDAAALRASAPADELRALGIDVVHDLPGVGENLQDHLEVYVQHACTQPVSMAPVPQAGGTGRGSGSGGCSSARAPARRTTSRAAGSPGATTTSRTRT